MSFARLLSLFEDAQIMKYIGYFALFNLSLIVLEIVADLILKKQRRWADTIANWAIYGINTLLEKTVYGALGLIGLTAVSQFIPYKIPTNIITWIAAVFAADFTYYWMHRLEHEHRILWASHSVHHSSEDYNLTISMRLSIVESLFEWAFLIPMLLVGFSPFQAIVSLVFVAQFQTWIHTERIGKLGILDEIFNTPSVHRVHHGSNKKYLDKNYGGILIIWDKLFGTFQREEEKVVYGLTKNINTNNPLTINFIEYKHIWNDVKQCRSLKDALKIIFGNLTWRPSYFKTRNNQ